MRRLSTALAIVCVTGSAALAATGTLTELMQSSRMTVVTVDRAGSRFLCAEHHKWTAVAPADLNGVKPGDIVRVERGQDRAAHLTVLRDAVEEIASPEN
jgi:hypothetical protein